ncbi:MAG TPA: hypothetical protein VNK04_13185 [Gemmataceae bacterium]|nr:hypothetical protein [Gemmataceae bacterium]
MAGFAAALSLAGPCWADDKDRKDDGKGKEERNVIIIQLDLSKAPPGLVKQLLESSRSAGREDGKKKEAREDDGKRKDTRKGDDEKKKGGDASKANIVQVDLNKLPPDLARRLAAELAKTKAKGDEKKSSGKKDDDDDEKAGKSKKDDDENDQKGGKGKKDDDDDRKGGKTKKGDDDDDDGGKRKRDDKGGKKKDD